MSMFIKYGSRVSPLVNHPYLSSFGVPSSPFPTLRPFLCHRFWPQDSTLTIVPWGFLIHFIAIRGDSFSLLLNVWYRHPTGQICSHVSLMTSFRISEIQSEIARVLGLVHSVLSRVCHGSPPRRQRIKWDPNIKLYPFWRPSVLPYPLYFFISLCSKGPTLACAPH